MVGKLSVSTPCRPSARACSSQAAAGGWSLTSTTSPPSSWRVALQPALQAVGKKPTLVSAATASATASASRRNSPARTSRHRLRQPRETTRSASFGR
jgi:hypothetical protein